MKDASPPSDGAVRANRLDELKNFSTSSLHLGIVQRPKPEGASTDDFFTKINQSGQSGHGMCKASKTTAKEDIKHTVGGLVPIELYTHQFYDTWLADMTAVIASFGDAIGKESVTFWVGSDLEAGEYHVEDVPLRAIVTYSGVGTEWVPSCMLDREAFANGKAADVFITDKAAVQTLGEWDVVVFRGGEDGVVHQTPADAGVRECNH